MHLSIQTMQCVLYKFEIFISRLPSSFLVYNLIQNQTNVLLRLNPLTELYYCSRFMSLLLFHAHEVQNMDHVIGKRATQT